MSGPQEGERDGRGTRGELTFDRYLDHEEIGAALAELARRHPSRLEVRTLGRSWEGREIWLAVVTERVTERETGTGDTGNDTDKPGFWVDGTLHAKELTGAMAVLYLVRRLLEEAEAGDGPARRWLAEGVLYAAPMVNPDGAWRCLHGPHSLLRSGTRPFPFRERQPGLHVEDIDGDGRVLQMRFEDPAGDWKPFEGDPRWMIKRRPDEHGGTYYRVFSEGRIEGFDGHTITAARAHLGLDFNRNFPPGWAPEGQQLGSGDYPGSEPETRAVMEFFTAHPNIWGAITYHTYSRAILRPFNDQPDADMDLHDLEVYDAIGERGTELTGYPAVSTYHHFRYHPKKVVTGTFDDWLYSHLGIFCYTVELWDLPTAAGITEKNEKKEFFEWHDAHPIEHEEKIAAFIAEHAPDGLVEWHPFEHPELGPVELGGWDQMFTWRNPPPALLEAELAPQADFALAFLATGPSLAWRAVEVEPLGGGHLRLLAVVENRGFLPTSASRRAVEMKTAPPVTLELELPEGVRILSGPARVDLGHLEGRSNKLSMDYFQPSVTDHRGKAEWLLELPAGGGSGEGPLEATLTARGGRAGTLSRRVALRG